MINVRTLCCRNVCCGNYSWNCVTKYYNYQFMFVASFNRCKRLKGSGRYEIFPELLVHTEYVSHFVNSSTLSSYKILTSIPYIQQHKDL
jgi:hypothetical protein